MRDATVGQIVVVKGAAYEVVDKFGEEIRLSPVTVDMNKGDTDHRVWELLEIASKSGLVESLAERNTFTAVLKGYVDGR